MCRIRPVRATQNTLIFKPEVVARISGGDEVEVVPQYEQKPGELPRASVNQLPDFISGFYNPSGRTDLKALNEIYEEKSMWLEIEYESAGKRVVARCELLYTQWHKNIQMGRQDIHLTSLRGKVYPASGYIISPDRPPLPSAPRYTWWSRPIYIPRGELRLGLIHPALQDAGLR